MKRWTAVATVLASTALACTAVWLVQYNYEKREEQVAASHRQLIYQSILQSYSASFSNGMTRAQVQDSLRARGVQFGGICCLEQGASDAKITKIGFETGPWYCTGFDVYVAFHFSGPLASQDPTDVLKKISIESLPLDCL
jgi:hypothetical protein